MKNNLKAVLEILETIEVHGRENMRRMLACMNTVKEMVESLEREGGECGECKNH